MQQSATLDPETDERVLTENDARGLCLNPKTLEQWKPWAIRKARVACSSEDTGRIRVGARIIDCYGKWAIILPAAHKKSEKVLLSDLKLWRKGNAIAEHHRAQHHATPLAPPSDTRVESVSARLDKWVVYCPETQGFLGGAAGSRSYFCPLPKASIYQTKPCAYVAKSNHARYKDRDHSQAAVEYMTYAEAEKRAAKWWSDATAEAQAKQTAELASKLVARAVGAQEAAPAPVVEREPEELIVSQEAATPPALPAQQESLGLVVPVIAGRAPLVTREAFELVRRARMEELAAEEMVLQARAARLRAEAALDLERMERALGLVAV